jgi:membrane-associated protease RseP (regulator of RpoE activity)
MAILGAHELGHFLACRFYGVDATWPHFLPSPFLFGTFGAFIRIRSPIPSRRALFDIAIAGPLAGFALLLPALAYGVFTARPGGAGQEAAGVIELGDSLLVRALAWWRWGSAAATQDLLVGPVFLAGWLGQLATCLNLFPAGQLDGGHLLYAWSRRLHRSLSRATRWALVAFLLYLLLEPGGFLQGRVKLTLAGAENVAPWLTWTLLLFVIGDRHPPILTWEPLGRGRAVLLAAAWILFAVTFVPVPIRQIFPSS